MHRNSIGFGVQPPSKKPLWISLLVVVLSVVGIAGLGCCTVQPVGKPSSAPSKETVDPAVLRSHVVTLSETYAPRDYKHLKNLNACAQYISENLAEAGGRVSMQEFSAKGEVYKNVIAEFVPTNGVKLVVGAHYDSCGATPGADDNASAVAGLLELAKLLGRTELTQNVTLVAFTLEEPPFFRTSNMGSAQYVQKLRKEKASVKAMICLEMIGTFSDQKGSQHFPSPPLKLFYPSEGNYIAVIGSMDDIALTRKVKRSMRGATDLPVHSMTAPKSFPGLDYSDHQNFWNAGVTSVMITDTAFHRNVHYHQETDTADRLDYDRMGKVVLGVYEAVLQLSSE